MMGTEKKVICYLTETPKCMKSWGIHITPTFFSLQYIKSGGDVTPNEYVFFPKSLRYPETFF